MLTLEIAVMAFLAFSCNRTQQPVAVVENNLSGYVNTFTGTDGPGNTFPGAVVPFGMVQLSPDNGLPGWDRIGGYFWPDSTIAGFSHTHLSGTGAGDMYDLLLFPTNDKFSDDLWPELDAYRPYSMFSHDTESASPGYYSVELLSSDIMAELTTTSRVGMHRYHFPADKTNKVILDLGYALNWDGPVDTKITIEDEHTISGYRKSSGWAKDQRVFFVAKFSESIANAKLSGKNLSEKEVSGKDAKITINFNKDEKFSLISKVAISSASIEGARKNMEAELPAWDFDQVKNEAAAKWNELLTTIEIEGTKEQKELFYTNYYHCFVTPYLHSDVDGFYKGADGEVQKADGFDRYDLFSLWDTYRTAHPLYTIVAPSKVGDFVQSFIAHYDEAGLLPVWTMAGNETNMMIGYHSVSVIVDAYFKGIPIDAEKAYEACKSTAMSNAWDLADYKKLGYVPTDGKSKGHWSLSLTLEYAFDDWCIARFAKDLGKDEDYKYFAERANNWKNHYDPSTTFLRPKDSKGNFIKPFVAKDYTEFICESNAWHYFFHVQHDIDGLIEIIGKEGFVNKLDSLFNYKPALGEELPIFSTGMIGQYAQGNEPSHHIPWLYNYYNKPEKTSELVHQIIDTQYTTAPDGYCGNEDCGQMSAWMVMASLGMYPVNPADGVYHLNIPWIDQATINLENGKTFSVEIERGNENSNKLDKILLNGSELNGLKINHADIMSGGELRFILN